MKISMLVGERFKEDPSDCVIKSHALMIRGGYMKYISNGIFSSYTPLVRVMQKIKNIIRREMESIGAQEVLMPVVLPASLLEESGRFDLVGSELLRLKDRNENRYVLATTHEEAAVSIVREFGASYLKYPFTIYQFQTKFRDEARPRGGLIRVREFEMKDAYSFHTSIDDLNTYYEACLEVYSSIFKKAGLKDVMIVESDSDMTGGNVSHEYIMPSGAGEDDIAVCDNCGYSAYADMVKCIKDYSNSDEETEIKLVCTPDVKTIEGLCSFFNKKKTDMCKAVIYQKESDGEHVVLFIRGDNEANETKVRKYLGDNIKPAHISEDAGLLAGFTGPYKLDKNTKVLFDDSLKDAANLICGANINDHHYTGLDIKRDCGDVFFYDFAKIGNGDICPNCKKKEIRIIKGIEIGNIFQLGDKYTGSMNMQYTDKDGNLKYPVMGCYGIGIGRLAASVCEQSHDENGPVWPMSIAPWQVHICCLRSDNVKVKEQADMLYKNLCDNNIETIYDDRNVTAGVMFAEADLLGVPIRIIVSPRTVGNMQCEIITRDKSIKMNVLLEDAYKEAEKLIRELHDIF